MVWLIVVAAMVVLGMAAVAGTGRFKEMPEVVNDRPRAVLPQLPFGVEYLSHLRLPRVSTGYDTEQVTRFLDAAVARTADREPPLFDVVPGGYDMQAADRVVAEAMRFLDERPSNPEPRESVDLSAEQPTGEGVGPATPRRGVGDPGNAE
ncbi:hypothetical protein EII34_06235 [Arachnia propionica]|uniref:DivIVA domain-containing protein n=1 Tax=Arachnia propionica TaxID=1750 RepID=A0A3P1T8N0_9ACTN|nr:hypothetical protein [Arachnia propionica]MDO5082249.1 hypothetical protein [Arachnia propionica]RRD05802.1 hypothetical protein EII34_06235 [Arachnia propionica]